MTSTKMAQSIQSSRRETQNLDVRYGEIGISAVAAAMRYQSQPKTAAISTDRRPDRWLQDMIPEFAA